MDYKKLSKAAQKLRALNHPVRQRILNELTDPMTVTDLWIKLRTFKDMSEVSQHLAILKKHSLVLAYREGKNMVYIANTYEIDRIAPVISELANMYDSRPNKPYNQTYRL